MSETLMSSFSHMSSSLSFKSARQSLMVLYITYGRTSVLGSSTVFAEKWRDLHFYNGMQTNGKKVKLIAYCSTIMAIDKEGIRELASFFES